jgi:FMN reductase
MRITVLVGKPKPRSRTLGVATAVADELAKAAHATEDHLVIDLAEHAGDLFDPQSAAVAELTAQVAGSRLLVTASPTYKATYTGMLKAFFDRYGSNGLAGVVAVPVMTAAAAEHALAVETHLRPLLVELGATVPARGMFISEGRLPELGAWVAAWATDAAPLIQRALG